MTTPITQKQRLLILDDDPLVGCTIQFIAEDVGLEARFTSTPEDFFEILGSWKPTHIALDLIMPAMDGVEVMKHLAGEACGARLIITSGVGSRVLDAAGRSAVERGLDILGVLSKPFSAGDLRRLLLTEVPRSEAPTSPRPSPATVGFEISESDIRLALDNREFIVVYQPKIDCSSGILAGFEGLVRWIHPDYGPISPDRFIPLTEATGLIDELTEQVIEESLGWFAPLCRPSGSGRAGGVRPEIAARLSLSINISAKTLNDVRFVDRLEMHCMGRGLAPERLIFELTETSAMDDPVASLALLTRLRVKGFHLSIDDFGTGFSSMLQLVRLPFSEVKVDKSFVMTAMQSEESRTVVKSIVDLGHSLDLRTVAEGVESAEALAYLAEIGCSLAQGFHIARPMSGEVILKWINPESVFA